MQHKTEKVFLKEENIDKKIVKLVKYINSFPGIYTLYSCQGGPLPNYEEFKELGPDWGIQKPYVMFIASSLGCLSQAVASIEEDILTAPFPLKVNTAGGLLRFTLELHDEKELLEVTKRLKELGY